VRLLTIAFGPHRVEMLGLMEKQIKRHQVLILEEPPHPDFHRVLKRKASIRNYLATGDFGFPRYVLRAYRLYQQLYTAQGISFFQVDPYLAIAKNLAEGQAPRTKREYAVWQREHEAADSLLQYYTAAASQNFEAMVRTVKLFARSDARRIRLREEMRSEAIAGILKETSGDVYVEAGYIHLILYPLLKKAVPPEVRPRVLFLLGEPIRQLTHLPWRQPLSPGDVLTLRYVYGKPEGPGDSLLAAQSLVYVHLVSKEEKLPTPADPYPHLREELALCNWVRRLTYQECAGFFRRPDPVASKN
jgi:hypothetical protein